MPNPLEGIEHAGKAKIGGHSVILWVGLGVGLIVAYKWWSSRQAAANASTSTDPNASGIDTGSSDVLPQLTDASGALTSVPALNITVSPAPSVAGAAAAPKPNATNIAQGYLFHLLTVGNGVQQTTARQDAALIAQYKTATSALAHVKAALAKNPLVTGAAAKTKKGAAQNAEHTKLAREASVLGTITAHGG